MSTNIKRALLSCTDKTGLVEFARFLASQNIEIISTGGTARLLGENGIPVVEISAFTGFPEMMDGRVKTLHPKVHGGLLALRDHPEHQKAMHDHHIVPIDLVVVNLYAFEKTVAKEGVTLDEAIENIDIGGPSMLRSAAKNHKFVTVIVDPSDYARVRGAITTGSLSDSLRFELATKVFALTARYDTAITTYLNRHNPAHTASNNNKAEKHQPDTVTFSLTKIQDLRYGENPHQHAAFYRYNNPRLAHGLVDAQQLKGKELSFNNILDTEAALTCCRDFDAPTCVIVKHNNPCGVASAERLSEAFLNARACDPVSSFGGIVVLNKDVDAPTALNLSETFFEVILAPDFSDEALKTLSVKKNLRLLKWPGFAEILPATNDIRCVSGGFLLQDRDTKKIDVQSCRVVSRRNPTNEEWAGLEFAWRVVKHVKSNAIVYARGSQTVGIGAGQMSRVDSVKMAAMKARDAFGKTNILAGSVIASDAFFPFRDGLDEAAKSGTTAVIQPGGSVRDEEVIQAADEHNLAMVFTGVRHFKH